MPSITQLVRLVTEDEASESFATAADAALGYTKRLVQLTVETARAGAEDERVSRRLFESMRRRTGITRQAFEGLQTYNKGLRNLIGVDEDRIAQIQGTLSLQGVANDQLAQATRETIGLAEVTGSMESAARLLARAYDGNFKAISRYLPGVKDMNDLHEKAGELFNVASANAGDLITDLDKLSIAWANLQEATGKTAVVQDSAAGGSKILTDALEVTTEKIEQGRNPALAYAAALRQILQASLGIEASRQSSGALFGLTAPDSGIALEKEAQALRDRDEIIRQTNEALEKQLALQKDLAATYGDIGPEATPKDLSRAEKLLEQQEKREKAARERAAKERQKALQEQHDRELEIIVDFQKEIEKEYQDAHDRELDNIIKLNRDVNEEIEKADDQRKKRERQATKERDKILKEAAEERAKAIEEAEERLRDAQLETRETLIDSSLDISRAFTDVALSAALGNATVEDTLKKLAITTVEATGQIISSLVQEAAVKRATGITNVVVSGAETAANESKKVSQELPWPVSTAVIPGVIALVTGLFAALISSFEQGGIPSGGPRLPNGEVLIGIQANRERVLTARQTESFEDLVQALTTRGGVGMLGGGGGPRAAVAVTYQQLFPERDTAFRRSTQGTVVPELKRAVRDGLTFESPSVFGPEG